MLRGLFAKPEEVRSQATTWGTWPGDVATGSVTESQALKLLAVTGSVQLLTETISTLPVDVYRNTTDGRQEVATPAWLVRPDTGLTFTDWCTQVMTSLLLHGNAYLVVLRSPDTARVTAVVPVHPDQVTVTRGGTAGGALQYIVKGQPFKGEMLHIKGMMLPGSDVGLSPLEFAYQSIQLGLSAQEYGTSSFDNELKMPGIIAYPGMVTADQAAQDARHWQRMRRKGGKGLPGVLQGGATWIPNGISNEAAQFLQTRQWTAAEICAQVYLVDPRELGIPLTGSTLEYTNGEQRMANLVRKGLLRWITRIEQAVSSLLPNPQYMKFNVDGLLRGDSTQRWAIYKTAAEINAIAAQIGQPPVLLTDEMREYEDLNPVDMPEMEPAQDPSTAQESERVEVEPVPPVQVHIDNARDNTGDIAALIAATRRDPMNVAVDSLTPTTHVHLPDSTRVELDAGPIADGVLRVADLAEQLNDLVEDMPDMIASAVANAVRIAVPEQKATVRQVVRDTDGRIIRIIDDLKEAS